MVDINPIPDLIAEVIIAIGKVCYDHLKQPDLVKDATSATATALPGIRGIDATLKEWLATQHPRKLVEAALSRVDIPLNALEDFVALGRTRHPDFTIDRAKHAIHTFFRELQRAALAEPGGTIHIVDRMESQHRQQTEENAELRARIEKLTGLVTGLNTSSVEDDNYSDLRKLLKEGRLAICARLVRERLEGTTEPGKRSKLYSLLSVAELQLGHMPAASEAANDALKLDPKSPKLIANRASLALSDGDLELAAGLISRLDLTDPKCKSLGIRLAGLRRDSDKMRAYCDSYHNETDVECLIYCANYLIDCTQYDTAAKILERALLLDARNPDVLSMIAHCRCRTLNEQVSGNEEGPPLSEVNPIVASAIESLSAAIDALPLESRQRAETLLVRAEIRLGLGSLELAISDIELALSQLPNEPRAKFLKARFLYQSGDYDAAARTFDSIPDIAFRDSHVAFRISIDLERGRNAEGKRELDRVLSEDASTDATEAACIAIQLSSRFEHLYNRPLLYEYLRSRFAQIVSVSLTLAGALRRAGVTAEAQSLLRSLDLNNCAPGERRAVGSEALRVRDFELSIQCFRVAASGTEKPPFTLDYAKALLYAGRITDALVMIDTQPEATLDAASLRFKAHAHAYVGDIQTSIRILRDLLSHTANRVFLRLELSKQLVRVGEQAAAHEMLKNAIADSNEHSEKNVPEIVSAACAFGLEEALDLAWKHRRSHFQDPDAHLLYLNTFLRFERKDTQQPAVAGPGCGLVLVPEDGKPMFCTLDASGSPRSSSGDQIPTIPKSLVGLKVQDRVEIERMGIRQRFSIGSLLGRHELAQAETLQRFSDLFPAHPALIEMKGAEASISVIKEQLDKRAERQEVAGEMLRRGLPISSLAKARGTHTCEVVECIQDTGYLASDALPRQISLGSVLVCDYTALRSLHAIGLLKETASKFFLLVPQHVVDEILEGIARNATNATLQEYVAKVEGRYVKHSIDPRQFVDGLRNLLADVRQYTSVVPSFGLGSVGADRLQRLEEVMTVDAVASLCVANSTDGACLLADDFNLGQVSRLELHTEAFSTQDVLHSLRNAGIISVEQQEDCLATLSWTGYRNISFYHGNVLSYLERHALNPGVAVKILSLYAQPGLDQKFALSSAFDVIKQATLYFNSDSLKKPVIEGCIYYLAKSVGHADLVAALKGYLRRVFGTRLLSGVVLQYISSCEYLPAKVRTLCSPKRSATTSPNPDFDNQ